MMDFKLDGGINVQQFEGVDYKSANDAKKAKDEELKAILMEHQIYESETMGKRDRKPVANYTAGSISSHDTGGTSKNQKRNPLPQVGWVLKV
jgi:hypothetical protein